jgi:hypothetical protein
VATLAKGGTLVLLVASTVFGYAPYQCGKAPEKSLREETPGEALYALAQKLRAEGDEQGYRTTLRYILQRYPSSHFAAAAQVELAEVDAGAR